MGNPGGDVLHGLGHSFQGVVREVIAFEAANSSMTLNEMLEQLETLLSEPVKPEPKPEDSNPFLALLGLEDRHPDREPTETDRSVHLPWWSITPDTDIEAVIRSQTLLDARRRCLEFYARCKQSLAMPTL